MAIKNRKKILKIKGVQNGTDVLKISVPYLFHTLFQLLLKKHLFKPVKFPPKYHLFHSKEFQDIRFPNI